MRFNTRELAHYASTRFGKADKEGALWMKECEGILKKKESEFASEVVCVAVLRDVSLLSAYTQRWFLLTGNLLFYCRAEHPVSLLLTMCLLYMSNDHLFPAGCGRTQWWWG